MYAIVYKLYLTTAVKNNRKKNPRSSFVKNPWKNTTMAIVSNSQLPIQLEFKSKRESEVQRKKD